jgi:SAM-dependent methyltransferase
MFATHYVHKALRRVFYGTPTDADRNSYYFDVARNDGRGNALVERWSDVAPLLPFKLSDRVLDIGCAEGLIALAIAPQVLEVVGFEMEPHRVEAAKRFASRMGIRNATFGVGSVLDDELPEGLFDVVLFLGLIGYPCGERTIGIPELNKALAKCQRSIAIRVDVQDDHKDLLHPILDAMDKAGFDGVCFPKQIRDDVGNVFIGVKRGSGLALPDAGVVPLAVRVA